MAESLEEVSVVDEVGARLEHDRLQLEQIFPPEVWRLIMERVTYLEDVERCCLASPYWKGFLYKKWLSIPFGILAERYADDTNDDPSYKEDNVAIIPWNRPGNSTKTLPLTGLLMCRLVSKDWNRAIEDVFSRKIPHLSIDWNWLKYDFGVNTNEHSPRQFLDHFEESHWKSSINCTTRRVKNPVLGRAATISYSDFGNTDIEGYTKSCVEIAKKYGRQIWTLKVEYNCENPQHPLVYFYKFVREFVNSCVNLKHFTLLFISIWTPVTPAELGELERELATSTFPVLVNLECLESDNVPSSIMLQLLTTNRNVKQLKVSRMKCDGQIIYPVLIQPYLHLRVLDVDMYSLSDFREFERYQFNLCLKSFKLRFRAFYPFVPWSTVFDAINAKVNSHMCTDLEISLPRPRTKVDQKIVLENTISSRLNFPNLTSVMLLHDNPHYSLDFLLPARNALNTIKLRIWEDSTIPRYQKFIQKQEIRFFGFRKNINESNINGKFPKLKLIEVFAECTYVFKNDGTIDVKK